MNTKLNILIIGGNGFIGSHLVEVLKYEYNVTVFDRSPSQFVVESPEVNYIYGDFSDTALLSLALDNMQIVYHLLTTTVPFTANIDPVFDITTNLVATVKFLDLVVEKGVHRVVYSSSGGTVYGNPQYLPIDEKHPCSPIDSYGIVKNTIERYVELYALRNKFSFLIVRPSNPYGPGQNYTKNQGLIGKLIYSSITQEKFTIWGDGSAVRDYIFIDDLTSFFKVAGLSEESGVFNAGSGMGMNINQIIAALSKIIDYMPPIVYTETKGTIVDKVVLDIKKSKDKFDWSPKTTLEKGLLIHKNWMSLNCKV
jgi:UDP-glucose 4-epimerase